MNTKLRITLVSLAALLWMAAGSVVNADPSSTDTKDLNNDQNLNVTMDVVQTGDDINKSVVQTITVPKEANEQPETQQESQGKNASKEKAEKDKQEATDSSKDANEAAEDAKESANEAKEAETEAKQAEQEAAAATQEAKQDTQNSDTSDGGGG